MASTMKVVVAGAQGVVDRWVRQYPLGQAAGKWDQISRRLMEIGEDAPADKVAEIIGNKSWTHPSCSCCNKYVQRAVVVSDDDGVIAVCRSCLAECIQVLGSEQDVEGQ